MDKCSFSPYEGNQAYIFVSYAHKDSDKVYPILNQLSAKGYRIWYDDGITPGSEWPENIAQHLNDCTVTMAFISKNSLKSDYCRREITFALSRKKTFLTVMLEDIQLPLGMELQLSAQQCVLAYTFASNDELVSKISLCPDLKTCLTAPDAPEVAAPAPMPQPPAPPAPPVSEPRQEPFPPSPEPFPYQPNDKPQPILKTGKSNVGLWIGIGAAVLAFIIALAIFLPSGENNNSNGGDSISYITLPSGENIRTDTKELTLTNETITYNTAQLLTSLTSLETLIFDQCEFREAAMLDMPSLHTLKFLNCPGDAYLHMFDELDNLKILVINGSDITDEQLPEIALPSLEDLWIINNPNITALPRLIGCTSLELVGVDGTAVSDLSPILQLPSVFAISADSCPILSIDCLADKTNLKELSLNNCPIESISKKMPKGLTHLYLNSTQLSDISGLAHLSSLVLIDIGNTAITDFSCISNSAQTLICADVTGCEMDVVDALEKCTNMEELYIDNVFLFDADCFTKMTNLRVLSADSCNLYSAHDLIGCIRLEDLSLLNNAIDNVSFLEYLVADHATIDLSMNTIKNVSHLPERVYYNGLSLFANPVDFSTIGDLKGQDLILSYNETLNAYNLPNGLDFENVIIVDCPEDQKLSLKQVFPANSITFMTMDEFLA
ncbi:MAG: TIR domain-containing protein [Oscillospiraceae bacterium]|nr:TIR domain-containing protein [Oscillospiraceae bacterium]